MTSKDMEMYLSKVPEFLRTIKDYNVFLELFAGEFDKDIEKVQDFTELIDVDTVPDRFLSGLGSVVGFQEHAGAGDFNRELLQRVQTIYSMRGSTEAILMAANHGANPAWCGGRLFVPGYGIEEETAKITFATDEFFRHNYSRHSSGNVFAGNQYRPGIITIQVPYLSDAITKAIDEVLPAGVRYAVTVENTMTPSDTGDVEIEVGAFGELSTYAYFRPVPLTGDEIYGRAQENLGTTFEISVYTKRQKSRIRAIRSSHSGVRSDIYCMCGIESDEVSIYSEDRWVMPSDVLYTVGVVADMRVMDYLKNYSANAEIGVY